MDKKRTRKRMGKMGRKMAALLLVLALVWVNFGDIRVAAEDAMAGEQGYTLQNPRIVPDSDMKAGQRVVWDCVWFGSYPQSEVTSRDPVYTELQSATGWDENGDIIIGDTKYRRIKKEDATNKDYFSDHHYKWELDKGYHYFKYEMIKWRVLSVVDNRLFLLSDKILDDQAYNTKFYTIPTPTWENSTVRSWLNGYDDESNEIGCDYRENNFLDNAFDIEEQNAIYISSLENKHEYYYGSYGGNNTQDKVFFLSNLDVAATNAAIYGFSQDVKVWDEARIAQGSDYAKAMGLLLFIKTRYYADDIDDYRLRSKYVGNSYWWLRCPVDQRINWNGRVSASDGISKSTDVGVRPALNLDLSATNVYSYAGTVCSDGTVNEVAQPTESVTPSPTASAKPTTAPTTLAPTASTKPMTLPTVPASVKEEEPEEGSYDEDMIKFLLNKGTFDTLQYLRNDQNFPSATYLYKIDESFFDKANRWGTDLFFRGTEGRMDLINSSVTIENAEKIIAGMLDYYQSDCEALAQEKTAQKFASLFVDGFTEYLRAEGISTLLNDEQLSILKNTINEADVARLMENQEYDNIIVTLLEKYNISFGEDINQKLFGFMQSSEWMESLSKGLSLLDDGLKLASISQDVFNKWYEIEALMSADEMYCDMLLYLRDNCEYDVVQKAAANVYNTVHTSLDENLDQLRDYASGKILGWEAETALDTVIESIPIANMIKQSYDLGVDYSNAVWNLDEVQELKDSLKVQTYMNDCMSDWVYDNLEGFYGALDDGSGQDDAAKKLYYSMFMLWKSRMVSEQTLQSIIEKSWGSFGEHYSTSERVEKGLETRKDSIFTKERMNAMLGMNIACPVDVEIYDGAGNLVVTLEDGKESEGYVDGVYYYVNQTPFGDDYVKYIYFPEDEGYSVKCIGNADGQVDCCIESITGNGKVRHQYFEDVEVKKDTVIDIQSVSADIESYTITDPDTAEVKEYTFEVLGDISVLGDLDGNREVDLDDALMSLKAALKIEKLEGDALQAADVDGDGDITLDDAQKILKAALHIIKLD